jgi:hypothetical protein
MKAFYMHPSSLVDQLSRRSSISVTDVEESENGPTPWTVCSVNGNLTGGGCPVESIQINITLTIDNQAALWVLRKLLNSQCLLGLNRRVR